jgi:tellurite resistance protein
MLEFDEPAMKSLLVELDERGCAKGRPEAEPMALVDELLRTKDHKEAQKQRPAQIVALRDGGLDAQEQAAMLEAILRQERSRHGISEPTDG